jgi:hypothetical protein
VKSCLMCNSTETRQGRNRIPNADYICGSCIQLLVAQPSSEIATKYIDAIVNGQDKLAHVLRSFVPLKIRQAYPLKIKPVKEFTTRGEY